MAASSGGLVDTEDFARINAEMISYDEKRERVIKDSRGVVPSSMIAEQQSSGGPAQFRPP